jgi:hypothetical protein
MVSYSPNAAAVLCFARVACEDIRQEFGVRGSNEVLCELANGRVINRELLREIANRLFEAGQGKAIHKGLVVDISRSDLAARKKEFAWSEYDIPESMGIPAPTKVPFSKFELERDVVDRMLRLLGYGRFSLIDPNAGQKSERYHSLSNNTKETIMPDTPSEQNTSLEHLKKQQTPRIPGTHHKPFLTDPADFGSGRSRGVFTTAAFPALMCRPKGFRTTTR